MKKVIIIMICILLASMCVSCKRTANSEESYKETETKSEIEIETIEESEIKEEKESSLTDKKEEKEQENENSVDPRTEQENQKGNKESEDGENKENINNPVDLSPSDMTGETPED